MLSSIISFTASIILEKKVSDNWELDLNYEHISRELDVDYEIAMQITGNTYERNFMRYVDLLDNKISTPGKLNPCSKARSQSNVPNILLSFDNDAVKISMRHKDKELLLNCEKFIDKEMNLFSKKFQKLIKETIKYQLQNPITKNKTNTDINEKKIYDLLAQEIIRKQSDSDLQYEDLKNLATSLTILNILNAEKERGAYITDKKIDNLIIIKKTFKNLYNDKVNQKTVYLSIFIISLSILMFIFHFNKISSKKNKIKKFLKIIID